MKLFFTEQEPFWAFFACALQKTLGHPVIRFAETVEEVQPPFGFFASEEPRPLWCVEAKTQKHLETLHETGESCFVLVPPKVYWDMHKQRLPWARSLEEGFIRQTLKSLFEKDLKLPRLSAEFLAPQRVLSEALPALPLLISLYDTLTEQDLCALFRHFVENTGGPTALPKGMLPLHRLDYGQLVFETEKLVRGLSYSKTPEKSLRLIYLLTQAKMNFKKGTPELSLPHEKL